MVIILISQTVRVKWANSNRKWYEQFEDDKGNQKYIFKKRYEEFEVLVSELPPTSSTLVTVCCDYCGYIFDIPFVRYNVSVKRINKVCCGHVECMKLKRNEINKLLYGFENQFQREEVKEKIIEYNMKHFGVPNITQVEETTKKREQTNLKRFGVVNNSQTEEWYEQVQKTQFKHYGVPFYFQTDEFKERAKNTCIRKYNVPHPMQNLKIKHMAIKTMYENGTSICSKQQRYLNELLNGKLNYPVGNCMLDIAFPEDTIYIEYDGGFHAGQVIHGVMTQEEFDNKQMRRNYFLKNQGWKQIRIISSTDYLPSDDIIHNMIKYGVEYLNSGHSWIEFHIDHNKVKCSKFEIEYVFGELRKIN